MAWVIMKPDAEPLTAEAVREFCSGQIAHYKVPRYVHVTDAFPMTVTGKIRKVEMREQAVEILGLQARPPSATPERLGALHRQLPGSRGCAPRFARHAGAHEHP